jgi:hypothetical protein
MLFVNTRSLFETTQTLFWAVFGLVDLESFELDGIKVFTRFWGMLMFGTYSVINIVVLLNLLIAMMNHSYQLISVSAIFRISLYLPYKYKNSGGNHEARWAVLRPARLSSGMIRCLQLGARRCRVEIR